MITTLPQYIPYDDAYNIACKIDGTQAHWWTHFHKYGPKGTTKTPTGNVNSYRFQRDIDNEIYKSVQNGHFTYKFRRTTKHKTGCPCYLCTFEKEVVLGDRFLDTVREHTSLKNPVIHQMFASAYHPGDFLGQHTDQNRGCAFIFHFSFKWKPEYGGLFMAETENGWETHVPGFGDLVLMELGETGVNHLVTEVSELAPRPRIAISGWLNEAE